MPYSSEEMRSKIAEALEPINTKDEEVIMFIIMPFCLKIQTQLTFLRRVEQIYY